MTHSICEKLGSLLGTGKIARYALDLGLKSYSELVLDFREKPSAIRERDQKLKFSSTLGTSLKPPKSLCSCEIHSKGFLAMPLRPPLTCNFSPIEE